MARVWIDGKEYEVDGSRNLLDVALALGLDLPYFCWHPAMGSVGACRQCAVKQFRDEKDTRGRIVMACMTPAADGTRVSIDDPEARAFRKSVAEWLMVNHPHDCPVCDEGGECHLQDMVHLTGQVYRRYRFRKRTFRNQDLGPLVAHEMNRCIECYRCVRFYRDFARGHDLNVFAAHDHVYFGREADGTLESPFAGNLVEVCPTGVFTDKTLSTHYTRKWDFTTAPSVCVHCSLGCNTIPGERYGELRRIRNRYHGEVNGYFLCDRGRYGYEFVNDERRLRQPLAPAGRDRPAQPLAPEKAVAHLATLLGRGERVIGIASPRASLEASFALRRLVGPERFFSGVSAEEQLLVELVLRILSGGRSPSASLREVERADAALVLGEDPTQSAPMLGLALRQAILEQPRDEVRKLRFPVWQDASTRDAVGTARGPVYVASIAGTDLDGLVRDAYIAPPEAIARFGFAVARALDSEAPEIGGLGAAETALARRIAAELRAARHPVVVSGTGARSPEVIEAAANVAWALGEAREDGPAPLFYTLPECNSMGLAMLGGRPLEEAFEAISSSGVDTVIVLENDLFRRASRAAVEGLLRRAAHVVVLDHLATDTAAHAELVLPVATFAEGDGTYVNNEGRAQRAFQVFVPRGAIRESWRWLAEAGTAAHREDFAWRSLDDVLAALAEEHPDLAGARDAAPPASFRVAGRKVARETHRFSGRTAIDAWKSVHEPKPPDDPDTPLTFTMEGVQEAPPPLLAHIWAPNWNSVQALTRFQEEIGGPLRGGDPGARLIAPGGEGPPTYFAERDPREARRPGELRLVPLHHVFGSEELSSMSPPIAKLAPAPYVALSPRDAAALGITAGDLVTLPLGDEVVHAPARILPTLVDGVAGVPVGVGPFGNRPLPSTVRIGKS